MNTAELLLLSVGLSADAFSASVCEGLKMKKINRSGAFLTALFFGVFQALMPLAGYFLGRRFSDVTAKFDYWIAFILLGIIGIKMIIESFGEESTEDAVYRINIRELFLLAVATSIDAMAVGIVFSAQNSDIVLSVSVIGTVTFLLSLVGVTVGNRFGSRYGKKAGIVGGAVLIIIGVKLFTEGIM